MNFFWCFIILMTLGVLLVLSIPLFAQVKKNRGLILILLVFVPSCSLLLYSYFGYWRSLPQWLYAQEHAAEINNEIAQLQNAPEKVIEKLRDHLKETPDSPKGWYILGKLYLSTQQYHFAKTALAQANQLKPNKPEILIAYAQAEFFANDKLLNEVAKKTLAQLLQILPNQIDAMNLYALDAFNRNDYDLAIHYWKKALTQVPLESDNGKAISKMIQAAQARL